MPGPNWRNWIAQHAVAIAALALMFVALVWSSRLSSPTFDEPHHVVRGLAYWWTGTSRLSIAHPPLGNALVGLPVSWLTPTADLTALRGWDDRNVGVLAMDYMAVDYGVARSAIIYGRDATAVLTVALGGLLYGTCWRRFGPSTARIAIVLFATQPPLLAHGRFFTTDLPVTLALFGAAVLLARYLEAPGWKRLAGVALGCTAAALTKYTGLVAFAVLSVMVAVWAVRGWGRFAGPWRRRLVRVAIDAAVVAAVFLVTTSAVYRFEKTGLTASEFIAQPWHERHTKRARRYLKKETLIGQLPAGTPIPLPHAYVSGLLGVRWNTTSGRETYFMGTWQTGRVPAFFPVLLATQMTAPAVVLLLMGLGLGIRKVVRRRAARDNPGRGPPSSETTLLAVLGVLTATVLGGAMYSKMNIGLRHVLPVVPPLIVFGACGAAWLLRTPKLHLRLRQVLVGGALALSVAAAVVSFPRYLGFYNAFAGGRERGHGISLIGEDWGQDAIDLAHRARAESWEPLYYHPRIGAVGLRELHELGIRTRSIRCRKPLPREGVLAVHARTHIAGKCFPDLVSDEPIAMIGEHIYVFRR